MTLYSAGPVPAVCSFDDSIDVEQSDVLRYVESRDMQFVKPRLGVALTVYHVARIDTSQAIKIQRHGIGEDERAALAFACAVIRVDNLLTRDGERLQQWAPKWVEQPLGGSKLRQMKEAELNLFSYYAVQEIGSFALQRGFLAPGMPLCFVAPLSSADALAKRAASSHRAATRSSGTPDSAAG